MARARPRQSRSYRAAQRIAARLEVRVQATFLDAVERAVAGIDARELATALGTGRVGDIVDAARPESLARILDNEPRLEGELGAVSRVTGTAGAEIVEDAARVAFRFNVHDPNVVLYAREQVARLVVEIGPDTREAIRLVASLAAERGVTTVGQAKIIREVVGLPSVWAEAPLRFAEEIRAGQVAAATGRRISAADAAEIRARVAAGTVDDAFVDRMRGRYAQSLVNRRARNIARTETLDAANSGLRAGWRQAVADGVLPPTARRVVIVTPGEGHRASHSAIAAMNREGVGVDEPFQTPWGPMMGPPFETNCKCGEGLIFPGREGAL